LSLYTPDGRRMLIRDLSLCIPLGHHLLVTGSSGAGKSSLLRAVAGLWTVGRGVIIRPTSGEVYFLPQRPYCTLGSLRDQLLYPSVEPAVHNRNENATEIIQSIHERQQLKRSHWLKRSLTNNDLLEILEKVDLIDVASRAGNGNVLQGLDTVLDWSSRLSLGEQQRLAFGRLLVNRPRLVILDEATSALDMVSEARMYSLLQNMARKTMSSEGELSPPGLTYISVGHRPSLLSYHNFRLQLTSEGTHEVNVIENNSAQIALTNAFKI
jgi:vitamin B12/bleomycin/antimicrobial peptide transport system ATP-binding/permease protein